MIFFLLFVSASYASFSESEHSDDDQELFNLDDIEAIQEAHRRSISKFLHMPAPGTSDQSDDMIPTPTLMAPASIAKASDEETQFSSSSSSSSQSPPLPSSSSSSQIGALWPPTQQTVQSTNIAEMTDEDIEILARRATEHHRTQMFSNFEVSEMTDEAMTNLAQQNAHPLEGYPFQYMGVPEGTYVDFYMLQPSQYMHPMHFQDTSPGRHITRDFSSRQARHTHDGRHSSGSNQEEMTTEARFYKSKVPREGNYTVITEITGKKVTFRVPKNDSKGWSGWFPAHTGEIWNDFGVKVFAHSTIRGRWDQWEFDYVGKNIVFKNANRPKWINITEAEYQQILKDGKKKAIPWKEELTDDESK